MKNNLRIHAQMQAMKSTHGASAETTLRCVLSKNVRKPSGYAAVDNGASQGASATESAPTYTHRATLVSPGVEVTESTSKTRPRASDGRPLTLLC
jgi:hypothetical protein